MLRSFSSIALLAAVVATSVPALAVAAEPAVAPPATAPIAAACERRAAVAETTRDEVTRVPRGDVGLSGCVSDESGIEGVVVRWASKDGGAHGRICTDPAVLDGEWRCTWDAGRLPLGAYELELVAVDAAGNRGSSTRQYELIEPPAAPPATAPLPDANPTPPPTAAPTPAPDTTPDVPEARPEPAPEALQPPTSPAPLLEPDAPEPVFSAVQQFVIDQVVACERGGSDSRPTDDADVTTEREQAQLVVECLRPALELAGADPIDLRETTPEPYAIVATVASSQARADLDAALPDVVAGIPVAVAAPVLLDADGADPAPLDTPIPDAG